MAESTSMSEPRRLEPSVWEIPVGYVEGMRVPGIVFANDELFARAVEDRAVERVANVATLPGIVGASYAMPDIHWGYGFRSAGGGHRRRRRRGRLAGQGGPMTSAAGCACSAATSTGTPTSATGSASSSTPWPGASPRPGGAGLLPLDRAGVERVLVEGAPPAGPGIGVEGGRGRLRGRRRAGADPAQVSDRAAAGSAQLGSLGGGNHFLEVQVVDQVRDAAAAAAMGLEPGRSA